MHTRYIITQEDNDERVDNDESIDEDDIDDANFENDVKGDYDDIDDYDNSYENHFTYCLYINRSLLSNVMKLMMIYYLNSLRYSLLICLSY